MSRINTPTTTEENNSNEFDMIDDDLEGVDDFLNEPNQFLDQEREQEEPVQQPLQASNKVPVDYGTTTEQHDLPPGFINYYSQYFQLSAPSFKQKLLASLLLNKSIFETSSSTYDNKELYGPIWISVSVILTKFLFKGLLNFIYTGIIKGQRVSTFTGFTLREEALWSLVHCIWLFSVYTFVVPLILVQLVKRDSKVTDENQAAAAAAAAEVVSEFATEFVGLVGVYGYGNTVWLIAFPILDILSSVSQSRLVVILEWIVCALASLKVLQFAHYQIYGGGERKKKMTFSMIFMLGFQVLFTLLVMFVLY